MKKEYDLAKMKEVKNPYPKQKKKLVGINLSPAVIESSRPSPRARAGTFWVLRRLA